MTVFYINNEKTEQGETYMNKYDFAKFIEGKSDTPEVTMERIRKIIATPEG